MTTSVPPAPDTTITVEVGTPPVPTTTTTTSSTPREIPATGTATDIALFGGATLLLAGAATMILARRRIAEWLYPTPVTPEEQKIAEQNRNHR